eukprot:SAG11_NODE_16_length_26235_cov_39.900417_1_plen_80_part_00
MASSEGSGVNDAEAYIKKHQLQPLIGELMAALVKDHPEDPLTHMIDLLKAKATMPQDAEQGGAEGGAASGAAGATPLRR